MNGALRLPRARSGTTLWLLGHELRIAVREFGGRRNPKAGKWRPVVRWVLLGLVDLIMGGAVGVPLALELPARMALEIVDTEPVVKGQTASGSYKPATLSNGLRTMVPTYLTAGTRVIVMTADGSYVERAKD